MPPPPKSEAIVQDYNDILASYDPIKNTTRNVMTKYEKAAIMSLRVEQLVRGAAPRVDAIALGIQDMREIAVRELEERRLPFVVVRTLPDNEKEYWKIADLTVLPD